MKYLLLATAILTLLSSNVFAERFPVTQMVFVIEQIKYGNDTGNRECKRLCDTAGGEQIAPYLDRGWRVISSRNKSVVKEQFREVHHMYGSIDLTLNPPYVPAKNFGCECIGVEYVIETFFDR